MHLVSFLSYMLKVTNFNTPYLHFALQLEVTQIEFR